MVYSRADWRKARGTLRGRNGSLASLGLIPGPAMAIALACRTPGVPSGLAGVMGAQSEHQASNPRRGGHNDQEGHIRHPGSA
jgi:hypothetical protein